MAIGDQIWTQTYQVIGVQLRDYLRGDETVSTAEHLADRFELDSRTVRLFLRFAMNYSIEDMTVDKVIVRYPHYYAAALAEDLRLLASAHLIEANTNSTSYRTTTIGNELVDEYWRLKASAATDSPDDLSAAVETLYLLLEKVSASAAQTVGSGVNDSIRWRRTASARVPQDAPAAVRVYEPYGDFIAYINDNAHYRFDRFAALTHDSTWQTLELSPLAKEIFASMRNGRRYELERCVKHSNWRQTPSDCQEAFAELKVAGLIERTNNAYQQTALGQSYFEAAEEISNQRLYRPWSVLNRAEYAGYKSALKEISRILLALRADPRDAPASMD